MAEVFKLLPFVSFFYSKCLSPLKPLQNFRKTLYVFWTQCANKQKILIPPFYVNICPFELSSEFSIRTFNVHIHHSQELNLVTVIYFNISFYMKLQIRVLNITENFL